MDLPFKLGEYAHLILERQCQHILKQEAGVLADQDPEYLHQMRVGSRRLSTALEVFACALKLPKPARQEQVIALAKTLGRLRDLDVQTATVREEYYPQVGKPEQQSLTKILKSIDQQRSHAFAEVKQLLKQPGYTKLKVAFAEWFEQPAYRPLAQLPLQNLLPDLLSPLLSKLLLHAGWLIPVEATSLASSKVLHDLRKTCKSVRYQSEFFEKFYGADFKAWINQLKQLQDNLGKVQDSHVLQRLLLDHIHKPAALTELQLAIQATQDEAMQSWESVRHQYLDLDYRQQLRLMLLNPSFSLEPHTAGD
jgi:CHAD domain-containing protein